MKLYMVLAESYFDAQDSDIVSLGIFDSKEKAQRTLDGYTNTLNEFYEKRKAIGEQDYDVLFDEECMANSGFFKIKEIELNTEYPLHVDELGVLWDYLSGGFKLKTYL